MLAHSIFQVAAPRRCFAACLALLAPIVLIGLTPLRSLAQKAPDYQECKLTSIFPAGGQQGQTVVVDFLGHEAGLSNARDVLIDGPPGVSVREVKNISPGRAQATLAIAADAPPGRRLLRVLNDRSGLTNMAYFVVGRLPEHVEKEPNNQPEQGEIIALPQVVNGRVDPTLDADCFRFEARQGQRIVAAVLAHAFDFHGAGKSTGFIDANLELLDQRGRVLAEAQDTLGLDPMIEFTAPADGWYVARVQLTGWQGHPQAVYRLTIGEIPLITSVFPPGGRRGSSVEVEFSGPNIPAGTRQVVQIPLQSDLPFTHVSLDGPTAGDCDLPFVYGDLREQIESEPNQQAAEATPLEWPLTINARFDAAGDEDWYRLQLEAKQSVWIETTAQGYLRSPVDTQIEVFDGKGAVLFSNDDATEHPGESPHDFRTFDSKLQVTAKKAGEYLMRVTEQSGASGPRAVYRLSVRQAEPDFELFQWPDAAPIWGPGSSAGLLVKVHRWTGLNEDIELSIEGLPDGWTGSTAYALGSTSKRPVTNHGLRVFLTITAPADAPVGTIAPFRVVGRTTVGGRAVERVAQPLTFYHSGDRGFYRSTPVARAVVAQSQGPWLDVDSSAVTLKRGASLDLPVMVHGAGDAKTLAVVVNLATNGVKCNFGPPLTLPIKAGQIVVPIKVSDQIPPGIHGITVARGWGSDIRAGMPGPCTPLIRLTVPE